ncbi:hypothetical protein V2J09_012818 [Rumex salicifolius]
MWVMWNLEPSSTDDSKPTGVTQVLLMPLINRDRALILARMEVRISIQRATRRVELEDRATTLLMEQRESHLTSVIIAKLLDTLSANVLKFMGIPTISRRKVWWEYFC